MKKKEQNNNICIQCGETREAIKRNKLFCCTMSHIEAGSEIDEKFDRHRFKPYSQKELDAIKSDEDEICRQMGDFADFFTNKKKSKNNS